MPITTIIDCDRTCCTSRFTFPHPADRPFDPADAFRAAEQHKWFGTELNICPVHADPAEEHQAEYERGMRAGMQAIVNEFKERFPGQGDIDRAHEAAETIELG